MRRNLVITIKQTADSKPEIVDTPSSVAVGQVRVEELYIDKLPDQVALIEFNENATTKEERYNIIYKIERNCKHQAGLQWAFRWKDDKLGLFCENCHLLFKEVQLHGVEARPEGNGEGVALHNQECG